MTKHILCVESGAVGGGSAESLYNHILALRKSYEISAYFIRRNKYSAKIEGLTVPVYYFENTILNIDYSKKHWIKHKCYNLAIKLASSSFPFIDLFIVRIFHHSLMKHLEMIIKEQKFDLVHTNNQPNRDFYAIYVAQKLGLPIICHIRTENSYGFLPAKTAFCNRFVEVFVAYTSSAGSYWIKRGLLPSKVRIINNAMQKMDIPFCRYKNKIPSIAVIGTIRPERGHFFLLDVISEVITRIPEIQLLIVGSYVGFETYYKQVRQKVNDLNLNENVVFKSYSNNALEIISQLDAVILPYSQEPFGRIVLEAWQCQTPVLLSQMGSIEENVTHGMNGLLFGYGNVDECAKCITDVIQQEDLANKLRKGGYDTYLIHYTLDGYLEKMSELYSKVLEGR